MLSKVPNASQVEVVSLPENLGTIEHSEDKTFTLSQLFENEIGPRMILSSVQRTRALQEY